MDKLYDVFFLHAGATLLSTIAIVGLIFSLRRDMIDKLKVILLAQESRISLLEREVQSLRTLNKMTQIRHDLLSKRVNRSSGLGQRDLS
jgi:hypothetical protein